MGKFIFFCVLVAGGYFGYNKFIKQHLGPSDAVVAYAKFADAEARNHFDEAKSFAQGQALSTIEEKEGKLTKNLVINPYAGSKDFANDARNEAGLKPLADKVATGASMIDQIAGPVTSTKFDVITEHLSGDSSTLEVKGNVCRQQPGCMGMRCTHCAQSQHTVEMCKRGGNWSVCSYSIADLPN